MIKTKEPLYHELSDWFLKQKNDVVSHELIAKQIQLIYFNSHKLHYQIKRHHLSGWIKNCRFDMEQRYKVTLYCYPGYGYKVATPRELAIYTAKHVRRTLMHADRTMRLAEIVDRKHMPAAIREVFFDQTGKVKRFKSGGTKFMQQFVGFLKEETKKKRKEIENDQEKKAKRKK